MIDIIDDVAKITTIPKNTLLQLNKKVEQCVASATYTSAINLNDSLELDIGIGTLIISWSDNDIKYKFCPSSSLELSVTDSIVNHKCDLIEAMEKSLTKKITTVYKELFK